MNKSKASIYLDYAAATPLDREVLKAMEPYFSDRFYNPSSAYLASKLVKADIEEARQKVAEVLGARQGEIIFTAGATEANNLAIQGVARSFIDAEVLVSSIEHDSVAMPAKHFKSKEVPVTEEGIVNLSMLEEMLGPETVLVSVMYVNNELGTIQPLAEISKLVKNERKSRLKKGNDLPLYFHTDAAQAPNFLDLHVSRLGVDMMSLNGGKIYGPKQSGTLYVKSNVELCPLLLGGGQEKGYRSGTENVPGIIGFSKALAQAQRLRAKEQDRLRDLRNLFLSEIEKKLPRATVNGSNKHQSPHIVHLTIPGTDNERLMMELDEQGVICAVGSACSASSSEPSHVLKAVGMSDEAARSSLRFSLGRYTSKEDIEKTVRILEGIVPADR